MSCSDWLHRVSVRGCIALGFYLAVGLPVCAQTGDGDTANQPRAQKVQQQPKADNNLLTLEAIQRAIVRLGTTLEAQNDKDAAERKEQHEASDLKAQWEQAKWAEWMVWVGWGGVALTLIGLVMIYGTLKYTKEAAIAAKAMVEEAKSTTAAAIDATNEARRQADFAEDSFRRIERPYIIPGELSQMLRKYRGSPENFDHYVECSIGNYGRTPAIVHYIRASFGPEPLNHFSDPESPIKSIENTFNYGRVIPANTVDTETFVAYLPAVVAVDQNVPSIDDRPDVFFVINTKFEDAFGTIREGRFTWRYDKTRCRFLRYGGRPYNYEYERPAEKPGIFE